MPDASTEGPQHARTRSEKGNHEKGAYGETLGDLEPAPLLVRDIGLFENPAEQVFTDFTLWGSGTLGVRSPLTMKSCFLPL